MPGPPLSTSSPAPPSSVSAPAPPVSTVVAVAAVGAQLDRVGGESRAVEDVVAVEPVDLQLVLRRLGMGDIHPGRQPGDADVAGAARRGDRVGAVGADDDHPVGAAVVSGAA